MPNLQITARLSTPFAAYDDWSPSLDGLLEWLILDSLGLASPNPSESEIQENREIVLSSMPLKKSEINGEWYWCVSSPCYRYQEQVDRYRKRWDYHEVGLNWGKRRAKWDTSQGAEKNYDLPLYLRLTEAITWYCVGDKTKIEALLESCTGLGKKRSYGYGQVNRWDISEIKDDWHLWRDGRLMRPMPYMFLFGNEHLLGSGVSHRLMDWGWRPPARLKCNQALCVMPEVVWRYQ